MKEKRMKIREESIKQMQLDKAFLREVNTKRDSMNVSKFEQKMRQIVRRIFLVTAGSKQLEVTLKNYFLGVSASIFFSKHLLVL